MLERDQQFDHFAQQPDGFVPFQENYPPIDNSFEVYMHYIYDIYLVC